MTNTLIRAAPLFGALAGALLYVGCVSVEAREADGRWLSPAVGCRRPWTYPVVNLPAQVLAAVHPNAALAPQQAGVYEDPNRSARWSPVGFFLLGIGFYSVAGLVMGSVVLGRAVLRKRVRAR
jgi:hypothetical protein